MECFWPDSPARFSRVGLQEGFENEEKGKIFFISPTLLGEPDHLHCFWKM